MTVKELHTFTDAEIELVASALGVAASHWRTLTEMQKLSRELRDTFEQLSRDASALQLKIEAGR